MADIGGVGGPGKSYTPDELKHYQADYQKSLKLFQKSLEQYNQTNMEPHKKAKFKQVMDESLQIMNETASVALKKGKQSYEKALESDYKNYIANPTDENLKKLEESINNLH